MTYTVAAAIKAATGQIGYRESGNNKTRFNTWLGSIPGYPHGGYGYPWCQSFQSWVADEAGGEAGKDYPKTAGCASAVAWFKKHGRWSSSPHVGDMVFYGPTGSTHVELVVGVSAHSITTVGGNTSGSLDGRYYNGDGVYRKTVSRSSERIYGYGRPAYDGSSAPAPAPKPPAVPSKNPPAWPGRYITQPPMMRGDDVMAWQRRMRMRGWSIAADGVYGPDSEDVCRAFQKEKRLAVDGVVGPKTWAAAWTAPIT
ncbi:peptidoglycan-binding protein [Actinomadura sp. KC216]|uniref:peptidoglycan-binding protein n=1 Tax=Actinomadura sp. KC216 TaxID=2530370 RepID=UPI001404F03B|nr:peptidoglycan-binding protein [Actinomadura sp. KC216]